MTTLNTQQAANPNQLDPGRTTEIRSLTKRTQDLSSAVNSWNNWYVLAGAIGLVVALVVFFAQWRIIVKGRELSASQSDLIAAKDRAANEKIADAQKVAADSNMAAGQANEKAASAQLELARLTGPPYLVPVVNRVATPDLSRGIKQLVLLDSDIQIKLPVLPKGKSLTWTLILAQDGRGQHQFTFTPRISGFGEALNSPAHSKWIVNLLTDSSGTVNVGLGGTFAPAPDENR